MGVFEQCLPSSHHSPPTAQCSASKAAEATALASIKVERDEALQKKGQLETQLTAITEAAAARESACAALAADNERLRVFPPLNISQNCIFLEVEVVLCSAHSQSTPAPTCPPCAAPATAP